MGDDYTSRRAACRGPRHAVILLPELFFALPQLRPVADTRGRFNGIHAHRPSRDRRWQGQPARLADLGATLR